MLPGVYVGRCGAGLGVRAEATDGGLRCRGLCGCAVELCAGLRAPRPCCLLWVQRVAAEVERFDSGGLGARYISLPPARRHAITPCVAAPRPSGDNPKRSSGSWRIIDVSSITNTRPTTHRRQVHSTTRAGRTALTAAAPAATAPDAGARRQGPPRLHPPRPGAVAVPGVPAGHRGPTAARQRCGCAQGGRRQGRWEPRRRS